MNKSSQVYKQNMQTIREFCGRQISVAYVPATGFYICSVKTNNLHGAIYNGLFQYAGGHRVYKNGIWMREAIKHLFPNADNLLYTCGPKTETVSFSIPETTLDK